VSHEKLIREWVPKKAVVAYFDMFMRHYTGESEQTNYTTMHDALSLVYVSKPGILITKRCTTVSCRSLREIERCQHLAIHVKNYP
jgi:inosine-uridine nucleoside N-ribohydrolase